MNAHADEGYQDAEDDAAEQRVAKHLAGFAEVENYNNVVKTPAPDWLAGYWQTKGPQRALVSPEAIGSLIVTKEGDTLDCRQWQRVIAVPGKLTLMSDDLTNVTVKRELYEVERDGNTIEYDGMTMERVDRPTAECAAALDKAPLPTPLP